MTLFEPQYRIQPTTGWFNYAAQVRWACWLPWVTIRKTNHRDIGVKAINDHKNRFILK